MATVRSLMTTWTLLVICSVSIVSSNYLRVKKVQTESNHSIVLETWKNLDDNVLALTDTLLKYTYPYLTRFVITSEVSTECTGSLLKMLKGIKDQKDWAFKMLDASGKGFSGIYSGTTSALGSFDQCVGISVPDPYDPDIVQFQGQYCSVDFSVILPEKKRYNRINNVIYPLNNLTLKSSLVKRLTNISKHLYYMGGRLGVCIPSACGLEDVTALVKHLSDKVGMVSDVNRCEIKEINIFHWDQILILFVFALFGILVIAGTALEVIPTYFKTQENPKDYGEVDIVMSEIRKFAFQAVINAYMSVDTFFFVTGLLVCYITLNILEYVGQKNFNPLIFIIRRVWRLLPITMVVIGITLLMPLIGSGPIWHDTIDVVVENCRENWWYNVLFINNFLNGSKTCLSQTWYTATDMQLYFLALIFLLLLFRKPVYAIVFGVFLVIASIASTAAVNIIMDFPPTTLQAVQDPVEILDHYNYTQFKPHTHVCSYAIGLLMGYLIITARKTPFRIRHHVQYFLWLTSIAMSMSVLYGTYEWNRDKEAPFWEAVAYSSLFRTAWVLSISWMTFACCTGRGGVINRILSWKALIPLSRLTFLAYLLHCLILWSYVGNLRGTLDGQQMIAVWGLIAAIVITFACAFVCHIVFEAPLQRLEKLFLVTIMQSQIPQEHNHQRLDPQDISLSNSDTGVGKVTVDFKDKETKIVTIHTMDNLCNNPNVIFTGYGRRLNDEVAKDGPDGRFQYITR